MKSKVWVVCADFLVNDEVSFYYFYSKKNAKKFARKLYKEKKKYFKYFTTSVYQLMIRN